MFEEKISKEHYSLMRYEQKIYDRKKLKLRYPREVGEEVFRLSSSLKKKDSPGKFYKSSLENRPYFNKQKIFSNTHRLLVDGKCFYCLKSVENDKKLKNRFQRDDIFSLTDSFNWFLQLF